MDARAEYASLPVEDDFSDERRPGKVIGTQSTSGAVRLGCDLEKLVANNRGALRFQPLIDAGWARQGIAYGPFRRENGLVMAVSINNGHNTSHATGNPDSFARRVFRWAKGPNADPWHVRAFSWMRAPRKMNTLRRLYWWWRISPGVFDRPELNENLALGWFTSEAPADPVNDGCGFVVHAAEAENGELWARVGDRCLPAFRRLMNLQVTYVVALRERGAVYYVSSSEGAHGMAAFPEMRPVAIDPFNADETLYASVHQSALGQIGFRVDTRLHGVRIEKSPEFMTPFGTAHAADRLTGAGPLAGDAEVGPAWRILEGRVDRTTDGASAAGKALAVIDPAMPSGLVHVMVRAAEASAGGGLIWRMAAEDSYWLLRFSPGGFDLLQVRDGRETVVASDVKRPLTPDRFHSLQILDSHGQIGCYLDGEQLFDGWIEDGLFDDASGVGILLDGRSVTMRDFEAHPRSVPIPREFRFEPPWNRMGERIVYRDDFAGTPGELSTHKPDGSDVPWEKTVGRGSIDVVEPSGARVNASAEEPFDDRAFYTLPWDDPSFADLEVTVTAPGTGRGQGHRCRVGLVFWQDRKNCLSVSTWLDDNYDGASMSVFTKRWGFEEIYDAVWTNVADKISWSGKFTLRIAFDGDHFNIFIDGEPIMQRALGDIYPDDPPLRIERIGIAVNWEWGTDTGSQIHRFVARR